MQNPLDIQKHNVTLADGTRINYLTAGSGAGKPIAPPPVALAFAEREGAGEPVILLHGGGTDHALLSWRDTIPALAQAGYQVYAPNYPGYGDSPPGSKPATVENQLGYIHELMDVWDIRQAALVGISMGGALAIGCALERPERVRRLVLIGSYGIQDRVPYHTMSYFMVRAPWLMNALWAMARGSRQAARSSLGSILHNPRARTEELVEEVFEAMQNPHSQAAFGQFQRDEIQWKGMKTNYTSRLKEITAPVLMVHGAQDIGVPVQYARRAAASFPNARLEVIENAGHWTQRDYPERFNALLLAFLAE